jgi:hypothetical protein
VPDDLELLRTALAAEAEGQAVLLAGGRAPEPFRRATAAYRASWEAAPPTAYGRLAGAVKAAILAGDAEETARYVLAEIPPDAGSPVASYAVAVARLVLAEDEAAAAAVAEMAAGGEAFERTAAALAALARRDRPAYRAALQAIVTDFEGRDAHLTGIAIADTAVMLEFLAAPREMAAGLVSPVLPPA